MSFGIGKRAIHAGAFLLPALVYGNAFAGPAPLTEFSSIVNVRKGDKKATGYDTTRAPLRGMIRLNLTVNNVDLFCDFLEKSGMVSSRGGKVLWRIRENGKRRFRARSKPFRRNHRKYIVLTSGKFDCPPGEGPGVADWEVSVVQVRMIVDRIKYPITNKLVATATHPIEAELVFPPGRKPSGTTTWSFTGRGGTIVPAGRLATKFVANKQLTPVGSKNLEEVQVRFRLTDGTLLGDDHPLNITAPKRFEANRNDGTVFEKLHRKKFFSNNRTQLRSSFTVLALRLTYTFKDQFGDIISQSDEGDKQVQRKETLNTTGHQPIVDVVERIGNFDLTFARPKNFPKSKDELIVRLPIGKLIDPATNKFKIGVVLKIDPHTWIATISEDTDLATPFTDNELRIETILVRDRPRFNVIRLKGVYILKVTKK